MAQVKKYKAVPPQSLAPAKLVEIEVDVAVILHAGLIIKNADKFKYSELNTDMSNSFIFGTNQYPTQ